MPNLTVKEKRDEERVRAGEVHVREQSRGQAAAVEEENLNPDEE
jgi:hypothetical protein